MHATSSDPRPRPPLTRPVATGLTCALALATALTGQAAAHAAVDPEPLTISVVGINDFHGRLEADAFNRYAGAAVLAGAVTAARETNPNTVFVSAGDNIGASTFTSFIQDDVPTLEALEAAGLEVSAVGNHEFDRGFDELQAVVDGGYFPYLGANVYDAAGVPVLEEYELVEVGGATVGFIGVVTEATPSLVTPAGVAGLTFGNATEAANRVAGELSDGDESNGEADVIVLLAHEGPSTPDCAAMATAGDAFAELINEAAPEIAAIFGGHTHQAHPCAFPVDGWPGNLQRPVVQSGDYGRNLAAVDLVLDPETLEMVATVAAVIPLTDDDGEPLFEPDPTVADIVADAVAVAEEIGAEPVGVISEDITRASTDGAEDRGRESALGNLVADIHLWATSNEDFAGEPAQIAFMNPGGLRADLLHGEDGVVTYAEAAAVQPFANTLVTMDLTGAQLRLALEQQWQPAGASRPKLHLGVSDGFRYTYLPQGAPGHRVVDMWFEDELVQDADVYRVVVNSFLASGGDNFSAFTEGTNRADSGQIDLAATVAYFESVDVVEPAPLGRAVTAFADVRRGHVFYDEIEWMRAEGIANGWPDGTFRPGIPATREVMAAFLYRFADPEEFEPPATSPFPDVPTTATFYREIAWMQSEGIALGWADGTYRPYAPVTRDVMARFLHRLAGEPAVTLPTSTWRDVRPGVAHYEAMLWMEQEQLANGWADGTYRPGAAVSREVSAAFLSRLDGWLPEPE